MAVKTTPDPSPKPRAAPPTTTIQIHADDRAALTSALRRSRRPVLTHLNADTTWLLQLPYPDHVSAPAGRSRFNVLLDPWLRGPQSDVAAWFSTQWHVVAPSVRTIAELDALLREVEGDSTGEDEGDGQGQTAQTRTQAQAQADGEKSSSSSYIDAVAISHEFTDHCHEATLRELPRSTPVFATDKAAELIASWGHFDTVVTTPAFPAGTGHRDCWRRALSVAPLPPWLGIGRVVTAGNALYYHSAIVVAFDSAAASSSGPDDGDGDDDDATSEEAGTADAVVYSPHGIRGTDLSPLRAAGLHTLALLHGLHDVRIWMTKQLNLGAVNGLEAVRASGARYWVATHDEVKKGGGLIAPMLRRTRYTLADAVGVESGREGVEVPEYYRFVELGSGDVLVLE